MKIISRLVAYVDLRRLGGGFRWAMANDAPDLTGLHVLVVDDNEDARIILGAYLQQLGASVTLARNAGDALAAMNELRAHVIISDLSMPGMDGLELLTRIRSLARSFRRRLRC